jgi:hypothetical protein
MTKGREDDISKMSPEVLAKEVLASAHPESITL